MKPAVFYGACNPVGIAIISKYIAFSTNGARTGLFIGPLTALADFEPAPHLFGEIA